MKIACLGLGPSLKEFSPEGFDLLIGVNDIWSFVKTDVVVCVNPPKDFSYERLRVICESEPQVFYSHMVIWDSLKDMRKIDILPGFPDDFCDLDNIKFQKSYCSPFIAAQIAYKYYFATEIHLFGCDMTNHPHLDSKLCQLIHRHFVNLKTALKQKGCELVIHGQGILSNI